MRFPWPILILIFFPLISLAQSGIISGVVTNTETKKPLPRASVFLSNSSIGAATTDEGKFILSGIRPGQYTLVVSILGYEQYSKAILIGREPITLNIELAQKPLMLRDVVISSSADWKKNYEEFKREFIGTDENAKYCVVMNPRVLNLAYNPTKQILHADADEFLVVENKALGYRVKYLVNDFNIDKLSNIISRSGQQVFEDLPGSEAQKKKWHEKREEAYYGSAMHFYRSLYADRLKVEGFEAYKLRRYINHERPPDDIIRRKVEMFKAHGMVDSANYWIHLANLPKYQNESLVRPAYQEFEILSVLQPGLYTVHFNDYLYVVYTKKRENVDYKDIYRELEMPNFETSVVTILSKENYYHIDSNGIVIDGGPLYEGTWSKSRVSDLLPVNYVPDEK